MLESTQPQRSLISGADHNPTNLLPLFFLCLSFLSLFLLVLAQQPIETLLDTPLEATELELAPPSVRYGTYAAANCRVLSDAQIECATAEGTASGTVEAVAEAAVVGFPHEIKGQGIYCYVTLMNGVEPTDELRTELRKWVRTEIGPIASPDVIQWAPGLPKTRSGKIMRRILRKIAENDFGSLGDTSTLADPDVVQDLIDNRATAVRPN